MAWGPHRLPSGLWSATVRTPAGRRSKSHRLKGVVQKWADDLEADISRGEFFDARKAEVTVAEWWERCKDSRHLEKASRNRDASHWRCHVEPRWGKVPLGAIMKPDVETWVVEMTKAGVGACTIEGALGVLLALLEQAVDAKILRDNQARRVNTPERPEHVDRVLSHEEETALLESLDRQFPGRPDARLFVELLLHGLRWEEAAAVDREHVNNRQKMVHVGPVVERDGTIRPYPKSPAGKRPVPIEDAVWPRLRAHALTIKPGGLLFTAPRGGVLYYSSWLDRVWMRALSHIEPADWSGFGEWLDSAMARLNFTQDRELAAKAGVNPSLISNWRSGRFHPSGKSLDRLAAILGDPPAIFRPQVAVLLDDPQPTPHDCRHTYGTRLGDAGLPVHEIMTLMGHETLESAQRYLHAGEDRFERARQAMKKARGM